MGDGEGEAERRPLRESVLPIFLLQSSATVTIIRVFHNKDNYDIRKNICRTYTEINF